MILKTKLLEHQLEAFDKLKQLKVGALYMEMGTGKTRTMLELIKYRYDAGKFDIVLWFCPCSVKENLWRDIDKHADDWEDLIGIVGIESMSSSVALNSLVLALVQSKRVALVVDESTLVKNPDAIRTERITRIADLCTYKNILTGTPVTRDEADLYAQWRILDWRILGYKSYYSFARNHIEFDKHIANKPIGTMNVGYITRKIAPYTYQVKKEECLTLPGKVYDEMYYWMDREQRDEYERVASILLPSTEEDERGWELQQMAIYRLFTALQLVTSGYFLEIDEGDICKPIKKTRMFTAKDNPRIQALRSVIGNIDGKVIIFCKFTDEISDIAEVLADEYGENAVTQFHGEMKQKERIKSIDRFQNGARFFVANKSCAGYGLNLQFCSNVVYYNNDFDFGTRAQSEDRVHRIGQENKVLYTDIIASSTLDESILRCLRNKEGLLESLRDSVKKNQKIPLKDLIKLYPGKKTKRKNKQQMEEENDLRTMERLSDEKL